MSDDNNTPGDSIGGALAFAAIVAMGGVAYVRDIRESLKQVFNRRGIEAALRDEQSRAKLEVIALAILADGEVTDAEREAIQKHAKEYGLDTNEVLADIAQLGADLRDPNLLREKIDAAAKPLTPDERIEVFAAVMNLAHRGSTAWPSDPGYRSASPTPEALITIFREALRIEPA